MANIIEFLQKEIEKGNTLINSKGDIANLEKLEKDLKKSYVSDLKNGIIDFNVSFPEYFSETIGKSYVEINLFISALYDNNLLIRPESPELPEPEEPADAVPPEKIS